jgi:hypothetical protein
MYFSIKGAFIASWVIHHAADLMKLDRFVVTFLPLLSFHENEMLFINALFYTEVYVL